MRGRSCYSPVSKQFRAPAGARVTFLLRGQEKSNPIEKATPMARPAPIHGLRVRGRLPGFSDGTSMYRRKTGPHPCGPSCGLSSTRPPRHRGPGKSGALPARRSKSADAPPSSYRRAYPTFRGDKPDQPDSCDMHASTSATVDRGRTAIPLSARGFHRLTLELPRWSMACICPDPGSTKR